MERSSNEKTLYDIHLSLYSYHFGIITGYVLQNKKVDSTYLFSKEKLENLKNKIDKSDIIKFNLTHSLIVNGI